MWLNEKWHSAGIVAMLCLMLTLAACGGKRQRIQAVEIDGEQIGIETLYQQLAESYKPWQDVYASINISLQAPTRASVSGRATMVRDQSIMISLRMMGMEFGVLYINKDSLYALDKYHKYYLAESLDDILRGYPMSIGNVQDFLLGQAFVPGRGTIPEKPTNDMRLDTLNGSWRFTAPSRIDGVDWWCTASETLPPRLSSISFRLGSQSQVDCIYDDAIATPAGAAQCLLDVFAHSAGKDYAARIKWGFDGAKWNTGREGKISLPTGYSRIDMPQLLELLKKL